MSKPPSDNLGGFHSEAELGDIPLPAPLPAPDAGISIAELQSRAVPLEWYEAVAITQGLCDTLCDVGEQRAPVRIQADTVYLTADGGVSVATAKRSGGAPPLQQVADLLRELLADKNIPTPLRLALSQTSASASLEEWSKMIAYYERPNRLNLIKTVYERAVGISASAPAYSRQAVATTVAETVVPPPPPAVPRRRTPQLPKISSRHLAVAFAVVAIPSVIVVFMWYVVPRLIRMFDQPRIVSAPAVAGETAAADTAPPVENAAKIILPPVKVQRTQGVPGSQAPASPRSASALGSTPPLSGRVLSPPGASAPALTADETAGRRSSPANAKAPSGPASSTIYSPEDLDVVPPSAVYPAFPSMLPPGVGPNDVAEFYVVVSETGAVESVRARRVPATMAEAMTVTMSLSAAKAWRFKPGMKNGEPVKYRTLVWVLKN